MEDISLQCEDCGAPLESVNEAYFHEDLWSHTVEPILNLVCADCKEHCRSITEKDLHTKLTGHVNFTNRTSPIPNSNSDDEEMIDPVDAKFIQELKALGLSTTTSKRALHYFGNESIKGAVNWIIQNADYVDIDQMPLVPPSAKDVKDQLLGPSIVEEEMKINPEELRELARKKKEEEEELERLKERIRVGNALFELMEEGNERELIFMLYKAEEEERAQKKNHQKLEEDKAERKRKLRLPADAPSVSKPAAPVVEEKMPFVQPRPASKAEAMRNILRSLKQNHKDEDAKVKRAFQTLFTYVCDVARNPDEEKFRKIRLSDPLFHDRVGSFKEGIDFLELCGFGKIEDGVFLFLARDKVDDAVLNSAGSALNSAISGGVL
ncbi:hypothetical protein ACHQM5_016194 [Ranunculus cassubicifolius]